MSADPPSPPANDPRVQAALEEYFERIDQGEAVDPQEFFEKHADIAAELKTFIATSEQLEALAEEGPGEDTSDYRETVMPQRLTPSADETDEAALPEQFGRYRVLRLLGQGAMGYVHLAHDTQLERDVALKTPSFEEDKSGELTERFYREARAAATLHHPNICAVYDVGECDGRHFISMAYIKGRPLSAFIQPEKLQPERKVLLVMRKLALALEEAHRQGIVHRDLKPGNVMIDERSEPIIMDFGLARKLHHADDERLTQKGMIIGSPAYMSPEQVQADTQQVTAQSDIYSLGVIFYELLTGRLPFRGSITSVIGQILTKEPTPPGRLRRDLTPRVEAVCLKMMAKKPEKRFASMQEVADEITSCLKEGTTSSQPSAAAKAPERKQPAESAFVASNLPLLMESAGKLMKRYDYEQVVQILEGVPERHRNDELRAVLRKARTLADEVAYLQLDLEEALAAKDIETAVAKAEELLELKPGNERAQQVVRELKQKLLRRRKRAGLRRWLRFGKAAPSSKRVGEGSWIPWSALVFGVAVFGIASWFVRDYLHSRSAVVKVQLGDAAVEVTLGDRTVTNDSTDKTFRVRPGKEQTVTIAYDEDTFTSKPFTLKEGDNPKLRVEVAGDSLTAYFGEDEIGQWAVASRVVDTKVVAPLTAAAPFDAQRASRYQTETAEALGIKDDFVNSIGMRFRIVPAGEFTMGTDEEVIGALIETRGAELDRAISARLDWRGRFRTESPAHRVRITQPFYLGVYEVTQAQYQEVMGNNPAQFSPNGKKGDAVAGLNAANLPVDSVKWLSAIDFCNALSKREGRPAYYRRDGDNVEIVGGAGYRLPTEAEWEFAARGGTSTIYPHGEGDREIESYAWVRSNSGMHPHPVGQRLANSFGLHDMLGNVLEWTWDRYDPEHYSKVGSDETLEDPHGPETGTLRVYRGGYWGHPPVSCRPAARYSLKFDRGGLGDGFRVALKIDLKQDAVAVADDTDGVRWSGDFAKDVLWQKGQKPVTLIHRDEGFACLAGIRGAVLPGPEVYVEQTQEGDWTLAGKVFPNLDLSGKAVAVRWFDEFEPPTFKSWKREDGAPKLTRLVHQRDGFCVLTMIGGFFRGGAEQIRLRVDDDGYWRFNAKSDADGTRARIMILKTKQPGKFRGTVREHYWQKGQAPVRLIHKDEGFAYLSGVGGGFIGGGEFAYVTLKKDGYWYLEGNSFQPATYAWATSVQLTDSRRAETQPGKQKLVFSFDDEAATKKYWSWDDRFVFAADGAKAPKGARSSFRSRHLYSRDASIDIDLGFRRATFTNTGGASVTVWNKQLNFNDQWRPINAKLHIHREGDEIVFRNNGEEKRIAIDPQHASKDSTTIEIRWRSRAAHFRRIEISASSVTPTS